MMSDIEEPPTKVTKIELAVAEASDDPIEGIEHSQEEWLSEGVLTDDDYNQTMEQDGTFSNIGNTSQDESTMQSTNFDSLENTDNPEIDPQEYGVQGELKAESLQMDSQDATGNLHIDYQESVGNVQIEFQDNGQNVKVEYKARENAKIGTHGNAEITETEEQAMLNTVEETLNNFENERTLETMVQVDNSETLTEDLSMYLIKKNEVKKEEQKYREDKQDVEKDDGNDTDELLGIKRSHVAEVLKVGERVGGCSGRESSSAVALRQAVRSKKRHQHTNLYSRLDAERQTRATSLHRMKEGPVIPAPQVPCRPQSGLACARCAPLSRGSWQDLKGPSDNGAVRNILEIGRQNFVNKGVVSRYLCDLAQCVHLTKYDYKDVVPDVVKDDTYQKAIEDSCQQELRKMPQHDGKADTSSQCQKIRQRVEATAVEVLIDISSAMSKNVLRFVAWLCQKAIRRVADGSCGTRAAGIEQLCRAKTAGLPLVFVPLHRSHFDYILVTFTLYMAGLRPPLVAAGDNMRIPFFGWFLRGCGAFYVKRCIDGSSDHGDPVYKSALKAYILNSLEAKNNLQFFIEGERSRTGKSQPPKDAGILSVIMDAYLDGTIDDALLVPVTLNYDRLVDGNFVAEQLGRPKQMVTFWSAVRGIWHALIANHGGMRVDFNQPISLKELVTSFQKLNHLALELNSNSLSLNSQMRHSSQYGADVSTKVLVEAIGRHLVYDAAQSTALMSTNVVSYVLLTEHRRGATLKQLQDCVERRGRKILEAGRDLGYTGEPHEVLHHALKILGRSLIAKSGSGEEFQVSPRGNIPALLELCYYANTVAAYYAPQAIVATAIERIIQQPNGDPDIVRHSELMEASLELSVVLSQEFILCAPCRKTEDLLDDSIQSMLSEEIISAATPSEGLEEQQWSRRFAKSLVDDDDDERDDPTRHIKYRVSHTAEAKAERRRLILTLRPLLEAYAATCRCIADGMQKDVVQMTLDVLTEDYQQNRVICGEAVSMDAIRNCQRLLKQWGVIDIYTAGQDSIIQIQSQYKSQDLKDHICNNVYKFNVTTPLLTEP